MVEEKKVEETVEEKPQEKKEKKVQVSVNVTKIGDKITKGVEPVEGGDNKAALTAFILAILGFIFSETVVAGIVLSALSLRFGRRSGDVKEKPYYVFKRIAKPVGIVSLILSIVFVVVWLIVGIIAIVGAIAQAAAI